MKMKNIYGNIKDRKLQTFDLGNLSSQHVLESKNTVVGSNYELEMLQDQLARGLGEIKLISLVGMGEIGKATFATRSFNEPVIMSEAHEEENDGALADLLQKSLKESEEANVEKNFFAMGGHDDGLLSPSLKRLIELEACRPSVAASAKEIQQEAGDNVLDVRVRNTI
ncbi:hypothetical protein HAX54_012594 [Datura stramonium]|uniref:Uncharacterized protein n=1 Tax=Datura stramonium TaxID=4076 RepID=A0ABS8TLK5_DATST|nr:hypothetical protein [Datura stramonium]